MHRPSDPLPEATAQSTCMKGVGDVRRHFRGPAETETRDTYLALAKMLRPELEQIEGFIDNERFASQKTEGRILSLSTWRDEKAVVRWRTLGVHHVIQETGRLAIFADYHLRVGEITADTRLPEGMLRSSDWASSGLDTTVT